MSETVQHIRQLLLPILESQGLCLWDIEFRKNGPSWLLRIYIDREGSGATLDDCTFVSRDLSAVLDVEDIIDHTYTLEVSTPGLDRVLRRPEHYQASIGKMIKIKTFQSIDGQKVFRGRLTGAESGIVKLVGERGVVITVPLDNVSKASWDLVLGSQGASA